MIRSLAVLLTILTALALGAFVATGIIAPPSPRAPLPAGQGGLPAFDSVVSRVEPSVVSVTADSLVTAEELPLGALRRMREQLQEEGELDPHPLPEPRTGRETRTGTGVVWDSNGFIVTNLHVVQGADRILVDALGEPTLPATLVGADPETDLALLKVDPKRPLKAARLANSDRVRVGEWVLAIGDPLTFHKTVTVGVVSGTGRRLGDGFVTDYIQTDAAINVGNSGGPLLNARGEVIGINTAISRLSTGYQSTTIVEGVGFAIPSNTVQSVAAELKERGRVLRGFLGVSIETLSEEAAEGLGVKGKTGALVLDVRAQMPADTAGLRPGDVILEVDGRGVGSSDDLIRMVSNFDPGTPIDLDIHRAGIGRSTLQVSLADRGLFFFGDPNRSSDPAELLTLSAEAIRLGFDVRNSETEEDTAPRIESVDPLSQAWDQGLRSDARIHSLQGRKLTSAQEFSEVLDGIEPGSVVRLYVDNGDWGAAPRWIFLRAK